MWWQGWGDVTTNWKNIPRKLNYIRAIGHNSSSCDVEVERSLVSGYNSLRITCDPSISKFWPPLLSPLISRLVVTAPIDFTVNKLLHHLGPPWGWRVNWGIKIVFGSWGFLSVTRGLMFISVIDSHIITHIQRSQNWKVNYEWELVPGILNNNFAWLKIH